uniref:Uncharacterized protein n=1 Tax=Arundo donax TaxID=35708 RepID=A0A0A9BTS4_ARUDO
MLLTSKPRKCFSISLITCIYLAIFGSLF